MVRVIDTIAIVSMLEFTYVPRADTWPRLLPTRPGYEVAVGFLSALAVFCVVIHSERENK